MKMAVVGALALLLVAAVALVAIGAGQTSSAASDGQPVDTAVVAMPPSYRFEPEVIRISAGATVTWHNADHFTHSVQLLDDGGRDLVVPPGESATVTFDKPGEYQYACSFHSNDMHGKVIVVP